MKKNSNESLGPWLSMMVIIIGTFMSILSSSIINVALAKMMTVFGVSLDDIKWVMTSYTLTLGAIIPLTGYLQEIFGAKKVYTVALGMFTIGSALCGFAWSNSSMIVFRVFQAIGGGMMQPVGMAILYKVFPREKIGLAFGVYGIAAMAAPAIGPTLGGLIIEKLDWRLIFTVNIPIGIIGVILAIILLEDEPMKPFKSIDIIGFLSSTVGIVSILYVLGEGASIDWSDVKNPMLIALGSLSLILFIVNELTHPDPLLDLRVLKLFDFSISLIIVSVLTIALMGISYVLPLFLQNIRGYTAMETGIIMLPSALVMGALMPVSGRLFDKFGAKPIVIPGLIILAAASFELSKVINMNSSKEFIILVSCIRAIGLGIAMMPISTVGLNAVNKEMIPKATALNSTIRQIASSIGITLITVIIQSKTNYNYLKLAEQITNYNKVANDTIGTLTKLYMHGGLSQGTAKVSALTKLTTIIQGQATIDAMAYAIYVTGAIVIVAIVLTLLMSNEKKNLKKDKKGDFMQIQK
ncbi:DHA2 family efflux MFS transporter permease subunit [Clostridium thailandense]|uniref:DHA2 family efflux MFS transporter permease subunit n=1 Tax=Clostridium thailandense TaxID=2794346 RepID=A0A949X4G1_9CLOT|nr:DHA2 family efflux MFS transporter permease subunit [Clostridium thailandense]MBV7273933.1 DHA2 family efflux MFS transporter permease subunit [Clostridium thailandense]MCH5137215.1 DHA2 family efflux MFS transporter permease subunit [Clostridiaceae bacterium UIB06]